MGDSRIDGAVRVCLMPACADPTAPTLAEIAAGIDLECLMPMDGLQNFNVTTSKIKTRKLCSRINAYQVGSVDFGDTMLKLFKQLPLPDSVFDTLVYGYEGFLLQRWDYDSDLAYAAGQEAIVLGVTCGEFGNETPAEDSMHIYTVPLACTGVYESRAIIAA